jgi:hypothetical protein
LKFFYILMSLSHINSWKWSKRINVSHKNDFHWDLPYSLLWSSVANTDAVEKEEDLSCTPLIVIPCEWSILTNMRRTFAISNIRREYGTIENNNTNAASSLPRVLYRRERKKASAVTVTLIKMYEAYFIEMWDAPGNNPLLFSYFFYYRLRYIYKISNDNLQVDFDEGTIPISCHDFFAQRPSTFIHFFFTKAPGII